MAVKLAMEKRLMTDENGPSQRKAYLTYVYMGQLDNGMFNNHYTNYVCE